MFGLTWANLDGYQMQPINDVVNGYVLGKPTSAIGGKLRNIGTQQFTPHYPLLQARWTRLVTGTETFPVWDAPNSLAIDNKHE
jgi:hypothetical protein